MPYLFPRSIHIWGFCMICLSFFSNRYKMLWSSFLRSFSTCLWKTRVYWLIELFYRESKLLKYMVSRYVFSIIYSWFDRVIYACMFEKVLEHIIHLSRYHNRIEFIVFQDSDFFEFVIWNLWEITPKVLYEFWTRDEFFFCV